MGKQNRLKLERWLERRLAEWRASSAPTAPKSMLSDRAISLVGVFLSLVSVGGQGLFPTLYVVWVACFVIGIGGPCSLFSMRVSAVSFFEQKASLLSDQWTNCIRGWDCFMEPSEGIGRAA